MSFKVTSRHVMPCHAGCESQPQQFGSGLNVWSQLWSLFLKTSNINNIKIVYLDLKVHKAYVLPTKLDARKVIKKS